MKPVLRTSAAILVLLACTACFGSEPADRATPTPAATSSRASERPVLVPTVGLEGLPRLRPGAAPPRRVPPGHGDLLWAVYVAVARVEPAGAEGVIDQSLWDAALVRLEANGVHVSGGGELACDEGALEGLRDLHVTWGTAVYFASRADAEAYASMLTPPPVRVLQVRTGCAD